MTAKLEVITGPMFSGKTESLILRIKRCVIAKQQVQVFKPAIDHRFGIDRIVSHGKTDLEVATGIKPYVVKSKDVRLSIHDNTVVVAFDEVQFFDESWILKIVDGLLKDNIRVICAGLDLNTYGEPFGSMPSLLAKADEVLKLKSICISCQQDASRTFRGTPYVGGKAIEIGGDSLYQPKCLSCWEPTPRA